MDLSYLLSSIIAMCCSLRSRWKRWECPDLQHVISSRNLVDANVMRRAIRELRANCGNAFLFSYKDGMRDVYLRHSVTNHSYVVCVCVFTSYHVLLLVIFYYNYEIMIIIIIIRKKDSTVVKSMPRVGLKPTTSGIPSHRSTTELPRLSGGSESTLCFISQQY